VTLLIIVFEPETRIGEHLQVVQFAAPPSMDGWMGWRVGDFWMARVARGKKEGERWRGGGVFIQK